jgi:hypothetical protein
VGEGARRAGSAAAAAVEVQSTALEFGRQCRRRCTQIADGSEVSSEAGAAQSDPPCEERLSPPASLLIEPCSRPA